jgi:signal transduction histidine kinase
LTGDTSFARLVSLACHDLRTPLATVHGFARTLTRLEEIGEPAKRYLEMMAAASGQLGELLDELGLAARIEAGRYEPNLQPADTLELARAAAGRLDGRADASGAGGGVRVDVAVTEDALAALALCALRHGGLERVELAAAGDSVHVRPITEQAAPIVLADDLRDLGAAVARRALEAIGGSLAVADGSLAVRLPAAGA